MQMSVREPVFTELNTFPEDGTERFNVKQLNNQEYKDCGTHKEFQI